MAQRAKIPIGKLVSHRWAVSIQLPANKAGIAWWLKFLCSWYWHRRSRVELLTTSFGSTAFKHLISQLVDEEFACLSFPLSLSFLSFPVILSNKQVTITNKFAWILITGKLVIFIIISTLKSQVFQDSLESGQQTQRIRFSQNDQKDSSLLQQCHPEVIDVLGKGPNKK